MKNTESQKVSFIFLPKKKRVYFLKKINLNRFQIELNGGKKKNSYIFSFGLGQINTKLVLTRKQNEIMKYIQNMTI